MLVKDKKSVRELKPIEADAVSILDQTCELADTYIREVRFKGLAPKDVVVALLTARGVATQEAILKELRSR